MNVHSIFESISGEAGISIPQGTWTTFIRLQGCNLRCTYCDTVDSQDCFVIKQELSIPEIIRQVQTQNVLITGGEPLLQREELFKLIRKLEINNHFVQIETNGSLPWATLFVCGTWVVDYKCPSSGMTYKMLPLEDFIDNLNNSNSIVKFVIDLGPDNMEVLDYNFMWAKIFDMSMNGYTGNFIISPLNGSPTALNRIVEMIQFMPAEFKSKIILSLQIHKICGLK